MGRLISELLDLPPRVNAGDFVLNLSGGVTDPAGTLDSYVVTEQLAKCFDDALAFIRSAVDARSSKATYLHGSFGSGKSHFMAVLYLLLRHHPAALEKPELAPLAAKFEDLKERKFLMVPYHMIGARNMETAILGGYVSHVQKHHPDADLPGVFAAEKIFENAAQLREKLGDEKFFASLNAGATAESAGKWGKLATGWDAARYDAAVAAPPENDDRLRLVADLVKHHFPAYRDLAEIGSEGYVSLDAGLSILSKHAQSLGYDALILFLDELVLWLASHAADLEFVQREGQKLSKLVESQMAERPVPIVSFVARQRDLRELVGDSITGAEQLRFGDSISHWDGRFHRITLEDRNLAKIAEKRILRAKDGDARRELDAAFERSARVRDDILEVLLTKDADRAMFRQVYPFSPALMQTLVAVSSALQRERTALKIMMQLLVQQRETLELGQIVPVGDLWDQVAQGEEAFVEGMHREFENARKLFYEKLRPLLEKETGIDYEHDRNSTDDAVRARVARYEREARLVKTLLLAALVPEVESLKDLTPAKLAALNHGSITAPIPGQEAHAVLQKIRSWSSQVGEIKVGDGNNPTIALQLSGVDTARILEQAKANDNLGNRQRKIRQILFEAMGIGETNELQLHHTFEWRGTKRRCEVVYANVREVTDPTLENAEDEWRVVIDFPFDGEGHSPQEDEERLQKFRASHEQAQTLVWLPSFLSAEAKRDLGRLVTIDYVLTGDNLRTHSEHLSAVDRASAKTLLENQQRALRTRLLHVLEAAYAVRDDVQGAVDTTYDVKNFHSLDPQLTVRPPAAPDLQRALEHLLDQALCYQYPAHPEFDEEVRPIDVRKTYEVLSAAAASEENRYFVEDKARRSIVARVATPLRLGTQGATHFVQDKSWRDHFNRKLAALKHDHPDREDPTVSELRAWIDEPKPMGLLPEFQDLIILTYAAQTNRSFFFHGAETSGAIGDLKDEFELREAELPSEEAWEAARERGASVFGVTALQVRNASNVTQFASEVRREIGGLAQDVKSLPGRLGAALADAGVTDARIAAAPRYVTALATARLLDALEGATPRQVVERIAEAMLETTPTFIAKSLKSASTVVRALDQAQWELFDGLRNKGVGEEILRELEEVLCANEFAVALEPALAELRKQAVKALAPPPSPPPGTLVRSGAANKTGASGLEAEIEKIRRALAESDDCYVDMTWSVYRRQGDGRPQS